MRYFLIILFISIFLISCQKDRANWDPTPTISNVSVINTEFEPIDRIDYTSKGEWWARILITGSGFSDSLTSVDQVSVTKNGNDLNCSFSLNSSSEIECSFAGLDTLSWAGAGTYYVKVKMPDSEWSNSKTFEVY